MKKSLAHLPQEKQDELELIRDIILDIVPQAEMIFLFGSYARGDWVDGPHVQGRGRLTIRKRSDYDIGARYDMHYKITKQQLEQLAPCVKKLHEVTEKICVAKIESFI